MHWVFFVPPYSNITIKIEEILIHKRYIQSIQKIYQRTETRTIWCIKSAFNQKTIHSIIKMAIYQQKKIPRKNTSFSIEIIVLYSGSFSSKILLRFSWFFFHFSFLESLVCCFLSFLPIIIIAIRWLSQFFTATVASAYVYFVKYFFQYLFWGRRLQTSLFFHFTAYCSFTSFFQYFEYFIYINNVFQGLFTDNHRMGLSYILKLRYWSTNKFGTTTPSVVLYATMFCVFYESLLWNLQVLRLEVVWDCAFSFTTIAIVVVHNITTICDNRFMWINDCQ